MNEQNKSSETYTANIDNNTGGQVAVGQHLTQTIHNQNIGKTQPEVTKSDLAQLQQIIDSLKTQIEAQAPPEKKDAAIERVEELKEAVTATEPDLSTMEYVKNWFVKKLPALAGSVTSVIIHPIVGKLVTAAGDTLADDFRRRFD